jgi:hypothetical protein
VVHMVAGEAMGVEWGKIHGSVMVAAGVGVAPPDHPEEGIPTPMAPVRQHTVEVNVARKGKEHRDATPVHRKLTAAMVLLQLLQFEHKTIEWLSMFASIRLMCQLKIGSQRSELRIQFCSHHLRCNKY